MNGLQPHRYLEWSAKALAENGSRIVHQDRMTLDDHSLESAQKKSDLLVVCGRDRLTVEEAPAVVELDGARRWQSIECISELCRNCADRCRLLQRMPPQIAHETPPGTFPICQQDRSDRNDFEGSAAFVLNKEPGRLPRIDLRSAAAVLKDPAIAFCRRRRVGRCDQRPG